MMTREWRRRGSRHLSTTLMGMMILMTEIVFDVMQEADGGYCAECLSENIFTQGDTWDDLRKNVVDAISAYFFDRPAPAKIRLY